MSRLFRKLHERCEPAGLEWALLRRMPRLTAGGVLVLLLPAGLVRLWPAGGAAAEVAKRVETVDILVLAALTTFITAVVTVTFGCIIVYLMKGPAYVADAYPLIDAPEPAPDRPVNRARLQGRPTAPSDDNHSPVRRARSPLSRRERGRGEGPRA